MRRDRGMDKRFSTIPEPLWRQLEPLLPPEPPKPHGGRPRVSDRAVMGGILYRLRTGCQWRAIPREFASGPTCHRRFQEWERQGVFTKAFATLLTYYHGRRGIHWTWSALDSVIVKAPKGGTSRDRTRRTAGSWASSGTSSPTVVGSRSR
jgi:transposase